MSFEEINELNNNTLYKKYIGKLNEIKTKKIQFLIIISSTYSKLVWFFHFTKWNKNYYSHRKNNKINKYTKLLIEYDTKEKTQNKNNPHKEKDFYNSIFYYNIQLQSDVILLDNKINTLEIYLILKKRK